MNGKARDKKGSLSAGPDNAGGDGPERYLEYENIPDPISFVPELRPAGAPHAANTDDQRTGKEDFPENPK